MNRPALLPISARRLAYAVPLAAGLAVAAAVGPAGMASAAPTALPANCTQSGTTVTCAYTAEGESQFTVPQGVNSITATAVGGEGNAAQIISLAGGLGAVAAGSIAVEPGQTLYLEVDVLGAPGGVAEGSTSQWGGSGGGESDVRTCSATGTCSSGGTLGSRLLVAGGGGGAGQSIPGGAGGDAGTTGAASDGQAGQGGQLNGGAGTGATQSAPGTGGAGCDGGAAGADGATAGGPGGAGGNTNRIDNGEAGGGGGAGWFGGGGGGGCGNAQDAGGGGGGGTSYAAASVMGATFSQAYIGQRPSVTLTYTAPITATVTTLSSSAISSVAGQQVTYTATVSPVPDGGTVAFTDGGTTIGGCGSVAVSSTGTATCPVTYAGSGAHAITATYGGDDSFAGSSGTLTQTVNKAATATTVTSSANPSAAGQDVTFTATVTATPPGAGTPTGTVTFFADGTQVGSGQLDSSGSATVHASSLAVGDHSITATYVGDNNFSNSSGSVTQTVAKGDTATAVTSSASTSTVGQSVTFTAAVSANPPGSGTPTGTVTFADGATQLGTAPLNSSGTATFSTSALAAGTHAITVSYSGDGNFNTSSGSLTQTVNKINTATAVASSANPSIIGAPVTYTATVSPASGTGTPTGTVTFADGGTPITGCGAVKVSSTGTATCQVTYNAVGSHAITAAYSGDATYQASTSAALTQQVAYKVQLLYSQTSPANSGATVPVKLQLLNAVGTNLSASGIKVTVTGLSPSPVPGKAPAGTFTFMTLDQGPGYQLNIKTAGYPKGTYTLSFTAGGDPTSHTAQFVIG